MPVAKGTHKIVGECLHCERPMRSQYSRRQGVNVQGAETTYEAKGYCVTCYSRIRRHGSPEFKPPEERDKPSRPRGRSQVRAEHLLEDWEILRAQGLTWRQAAPRIGVSDSAMDQALRRARKRGDDRGNLFTYHPTRSAA